MSWFDKVKDSASRATRIARTKSGEIYEITKLNLSINDCETKIEKMFKNVGVLCYRDFENGIELSEDIRLILEDIDQKYKEIEKIKSRINDIKSVSVCPVCGGNNISGAKFCNNCGESLVKPEDTED